MFTNLLLLAVTAPRKRAPSLKPLGSWPRWLQKSLLVLLLTGLPAATLHAAESAHNLDAPSRRDVAIPFPFSFCDKYTFFRSAWHRPMNLYVSRNATNHQVAVTRRAVQRWNMLFRRNVISFRGRHAYKIASRYTWRNHPKKDNDAFGFQANNDGASIIYFLPQYAEFNSNLDAGWDGIATFTTQHYVVYRDPNTGDTLTTRQIREADIYIKGGSFNSAQPFQQIALVMHEIGHALGLAHIPISGNIMSYSEEAAIIQILRPFVVTMDEYLDDNTNLVGNIDNIPTREWLNFLNSDEALQRMSYDLMTPQAQDKTALMCLYDFDTWGR